MEVLQDQSFWNAVTALFGNHPAAAVIATGSTLVVGILAAVGSLFGVVKTKNNGKLRTWGIPLGIKLAKKGAKKFGPKRWEENIEPFLDKSFFGGLVALIDGVRIGLRRYDARKGASRS